MYETIDLLQQTTDYYYIDYIPYNTDDPNFLELEEYFDIKRIAGSDRFETNLKILKGYATLMNFKKTPLCI